MIATQAKTIWKFRLPFASVATIEMPLGARVLCVQRQGDETCLWATVDPDAPRELRRFVTCGTGHELPEGVALAYLGTVQTSGGAYVWHVFEEPR